MVPLMMHNVISLPVPSQPGAQLLARAAKQPAGVNPACTSYAKDTKLFFSFAGAKCTWAHMLLHYWWWFFSGA